jgi:conjugative relaxase-like TrwC/TraI family protein
MIRMVQSSSEDHAKAYFSDALSKSDYYINDQELSGRLQGRLAERLGLGKGSVDKETFFALCENRHPLTGESLTPRTRENRRVGYDINFHSPKSVSIIHALSKDSHIADSFQASVNAVMKAIETDCQTRVRKDGAFHNRATKELLWAEFMHQTARPTNGHVPDPHLHMHCFTFNMTWDEEEKRVKAGDFAEIKRDMPYYQALFYKIFSDKLIEQGYSIRKTAKSFEIDGVPKAVIDLFSKRTDEIGQYAKEKGITDPKKLSEIGARTRSAKQKGLTMPELRTAWKNQIENLEGVSAEEKHKDIRYAKKSYHQRITLGNCVNYALMHSFERASVIPERRLLESALKHGIGDRNESSDTIAKAIHSDDRIIKVKDGGRWKCTTKEVLAEEKEMVNLARQGRGAIKPLYQESPEMDLKDQQKNAVTHVLTTSNRVSIIRGAAGTGKTKLLKTTEEFINKAGKKITVVAPTAEASKGVLVSDGFKDAETIARLLVDKKMQEGLKDQVLIVDEAGLLGTKDMAALLKLANKQNAQLILCGDTRQHASVVRGDALRILNTVAGIQSAEVSKIYRQKTQHYKTAVEDLSQGKVKSAFDRLKNITHIKNYEVNLLIEKLHCVQIACK